MMVASSFDLWKKDVFFPAAEEFQESAGMWKKWSIRKQLGGRTKKKGSALSSGEKNRNKGSKAAWQCTEVGVGEKKSGSKGIPPKLPVFNFLYFLFVLLPSCFSRLTNTEKKT